MAAVRRNGSNLRQLALAAGLSESACRKALAVPLPAAEVAIAEFLGLPLNELWPDRYPLPASPFDYATDGDKAASLNAAAGQTLPTSALSPAE